MWNYFADKLKTETHHLHRYQYCNTIFSARCEVPGWYRKDRSSSRSESGFLLRHSTICILGSSILHQEHLPIKHRIQSPDHWETLRPWFDLCTNSGKGPWRPVPGREPSPNGSFLGLWDLPKYSFCTIRKCFFGALDEPNSCGSCTCDLKGGFWNRRAGWLFHPLRDHPRCDSKPLAANGHPGCHGETLQCGRGYSRCQSCSLESHVGCWPWGGTSQVLQNRVWTSPRKDI